MPLRVALRVEPGRLNAASPLRRSHALAARWAAIAPVLLLAALMALPPTSPGRMGPSAGPSTTVGHGSAPRSIVPSARPPSPPNASPLGTRGVGPASSGTAYATNDSPAPELGTVLSKVGVATGPMSTVYDPQNGYVYTLAYGTSAGVVSVINGTTTIANLTVGVGPYGLAYDSLHNYLYAGNYDNGNGNTVSVISGTQVIATVSVALGPFWQVYDPGHGWDYSLGYLGGVTVLNGTKVQATLTGTLGMFGGAYDPVNGYVYMTENSLGELLVYNGTKSVASVFVGGQPTWPAVDPRTGDVYVANGGASSVTVVNGTKIVKSVSVAGTPVAFAFDERHGWMDVGISASPDAVAVLNGTKVEATVNLKGTGYLENLAYDSENGYVYVPFGTSIEVINGTSLAGILSVTSDFGYAASQMAFVPADGEFYVPNYNANAVLVLSTILATGTPEVVPAGDPAGSADVGQTVESRSVLWAIGTGKDVPGAETVPMNGLGCPSSPTLEELDGALTVQMLCTPTDAGRYSIWLNTTDGNATVWSRVEFEVFPALLAHTPVASVGTLDNVTRIDAGQRANITETPTGGTGNYTRYNWSALGGPSCPAFGQPRFSCLFPIPGTYALTVRVNDSNGVESVLSPTLSLVVSARPSVAAPTANRTSADVGQPVTFTGVARGGTRTLTEFHWDGLTNGSCSGLASATATCVFARATNLSVRFSVTDSAGVTTAESPPTSFVVYALPTTGTPSASRASLDVAQTVNLSTQVSGGSGSLTFLWSGLPDGCAQTQTSAPRCTPDEPGHFTVVVRAVDSNGGSSAPSAPVQITVASDPSVGAPTFSAASVEVGQPLTIQAVASGGYGPYVYAWTGLPIGCEATSSVVSCRPSVAGTLRVSVAVTDSNGFEALSPVSSLVVTSPPSPAPTIGGLSPPLFAGLLAGIAVVGVVAVFGLWRHRHR